MTYFNPTAGGDPSANSMAYFPLADPGNGGGVTPGGGGGRQVFGGYSDGSTLPPNAIPPGMFADDMAFDYVDSLDQNDPKRRRIARACDMCRKKKIKCDGKMPACTHCQNYKTECIFTQVEKKRNPPKGAKYIEGLENRLGRMESLLRLSGLLSDEDAGDTDLGTLEKRLQDKTRERERTGSEVGDGPGMARGGTSSTAGTPRQVTASSPQSGGTPEPTKGPEDVEVLSDMMCSLVTNNCGETRYIGSSSGFSIFSPKGIQWVNEKTGDASFQDMIQSQAVDDNKWIQWKPDVFRDIFARRVYLPLPPRNEALSLLKDFFENFNCMFPLFHEPTFMHLVEKHYSRDPYEGSGWWASLNVALAIAHRLRVMSNLVPQEEDQKAWGYLKNAMAVQTELTIRNTDLLSVQALLGMALFLQGTPNPQPSFFLVAAAIRLSHSIGLHKRGSGFGLGPSEVEQRKRVFWIAYMLDRDICLRSGRPPIQDDDDMNVDLPSEDPPDNIGNIPLADGKGKINLFRLMATFAVIASKVYKQLYSVKAAKQSDGELLNTIGELDNELEKWKDSIPIDFRPEHEIKASHTPLILHVVVLHFAYYNCLTTIHRMSVHHGYWTSRLSNYAIQGLNARPLNPRVFSSAALCVSAARASIHLIKYIPQGDFACVWLILYYPVSALVTLFANILQNPQDGRAKSDLKLMNHVVAFLGMLCVDDENTSVRRMLNVCTEFERIARVVLEKAEKESHSRRKRKQAENSDDKDAKSEITSTPGKAKSVASEGRTPQPSQPGNIPNVFTPPDLSKYFNEEGFAHMNNLSGELDPATQQWLSPRLANMAGPSAAHAARGSVSSSIPYDFASPQTQSSTSPLANAHNSPHQNPTSTPRPHVNGGGGGPPMMMNTMFPAHHAAAIAADNLGMANAFQHPFVPQDLWQMPMTLEWDWADMTGQQMGFQAGGGPPAPPHGGPGVNGEGR